MRIRKILFGFGGFFVDWDAICFCLMLQLHSVWVYSIDLSNFSCSLDNTGIYLFLSLNIFRDRLLWFRQF